MGIHLRAATGRHATKPLAFVCVGLKRPKFKMLKVRKADSKLHMFVGVIDWSAVALAAVNVIKRSCMQNTGCSRKKRTKFNEP